ncbi:hypothetical protein [Nonomuraea angiospora]|uniref:hypothetical protein n=1 Tax=Nonomuraea angiospora TaxID=46172 RepID=UPI0029A13FAD|nr:hypothetical protein [Nonomuraea angiospora]MDX3111390.1 hypothetical protein [Nonomuraea angiospora]
MTTKFIATLLALVLLAAVWLGFAYLMRDSGLAPGILGWGLIGYMLTAYWAIVAAAER